ncbi:MULTISPECIES: trypco2 family protein [Nonomuraea]|uniref:Trypco2 family protein n=1 Tax=Nonomuraea mangrovi TaxID=2316207 RepID=A0ABW4SZW5_9ACTN
MEIGLADTIQALRQELITAMADGQDQPVRFHVESVDLELQVAVTASAEASAGIKFWVLSANGKASASTTSTHTVSLHLAAETEGGGRVLTSSQGRPARR